MPRFNKHIIIVGSARSGTSWLAETIAKQYRYRSLFEPEHEFNTPKGHLLCDAFFKEKDSIPTEADRYLKQVFRNRVDNDWIAQNSNRKWKRHLWPLIPKKFVIKFVRCNLGAHAMQHTYGIPVVHLLRNPYDVLHSQNRVKFSWLYDMDHFTKQEDLVRLLADNFSFNFDITKGYTPIEKLTVRWCIENVVPIKVQRAESVNYRLIRYEDLRKDLQVFLDLCRDYNLTPLADIKEEYTQPSSKTHPKSEIRQSTNSSEKFTPDVLAQINTILDTFGADFYPRQHA